MITTIPNDPFAGISLPPPTRINQVADSMGEQSVAVQVTADQTRIVDPGDLVKGSKRPMKPNTDSVSGTYNQQEPQIFENGAINAVGADGTLNAVTKHSTWVPGTTFPATLKTSNFPTSITLNTSGFEIDNGSERVQIFFSAFNKNMSIKEIDVCVSGVNKKMLILASDPYTP